MSITIYKLETAFHVNANIWYNIHMNNPLLRIRQLKEFAPDSQKQVLDYILSNPEEVTKLTIRQLAEKTYSSPSSIVRICRQLGFEGFSELKKDILIDLITLESNNEQKEVEKNDSLKEIIDKVTEINIRSLQESKSILDEETLSKCIELLAKAKTILCFGIGSSYNVAKDAYLKFLRINKPCVVNEDFHSQILMAKNATKDDVAILISYSGETKESIDIVDICKQKGTPTIAITRLKNSALSKECDYVLYVSATEPLFRKGAMSSRIAQLNIIDILFTGLINREYDDSIKQLINTQIFKERYM